MKSTTGEPKGVIFVRLLPADRAVEITKVARGSNKLYMVDKCGNVYWHGPKCPGFLGAQSSPGDRRALVRIGAISNSTAKEWAALARKREADSALRYAAKRLSADAKLLGIRLTQTQRERVRKAGVTL